jgi:hypothetical protein
MPLRPHLPLTPHRRTQHARCPAAPFSSTPHGAGPGCVQPGRRGLLIATAGVVGLMATGGALWIAPRLPGSPAPARPGGPPTIASADVHALTAPPEAEAGVEALGRYLALIGPDEERVARAVYRWVTDRVRYDVAAWRGGGGEASPEGVLRRRAAVCAGYANLTAALARAAGLHAEIVEGLAKGAGYDPDQPGDKANHAWNSVSINGEWRLLETTWGAGHVAGDAFQPSFSEFYFCPPPEQLLWSHLPDDQHWQLVARPLSRRTFLDRPWLRPPAFALGIQPPAGTTWRLRAPVRVEVTAPRDVAIAAQLVTQGRHRSLPVLRSGTLAAVEVPPLPAGGGLQLFAGPKSASVLEAVLSYHLT